MTPEQKARRRVKDAENRAERTPERVLKDRESSRKRTADSRKRHPDAWRPYYEANKPRLHAQSVAWQKAHPERQKEYSRKSMAMTRWHVTTARQTRSKAAIDRFGPSEISPEYVLELFDEQKGLCHWFGTPMVASVENHDPRRPSLDRLDNSKGYVKGNVVLATWFANRGRYLYPAEDFRTFIEELKAQLQKMKKAGHRPRQGVR